MKPRDPIEYGTTGGTGPLNNEAACIKKQALVSGGTKTVT